MSVRLSRTLKKQPMRIIKRGREPKKEIEQTCECCGCVFAYTKCDIKHASQYDDTLIWVVCPCCWRHIAVKPEQILI